MSATTDHITTGEPTFESVAAWLDEREGHQVEAVLENARGITRRWRGRLSRRRTFGLPGARVILPLPAGERWLRVGGRNLPVVLRREDFAGARTDGDGVTLELGRARLTIEAAR